eukprot:COSAG02_NODE_10236_length_1989_cov_3.931513_2_plen_263_part_00
MHPLNVASFYVDEHSGFLVDDFDVKCDDGLYVLHYHIALAFVLLYALGIPVGVGWQLWKQRDAIKNGRGPSEFQMLYRDFKPDCCLWEIYGMLQKAILVGVLGFVFPGQIMQASVGLLISSLFLLAFTVKMPFNDQRTNMLAIIAQFIQAFSYFSTILLKVDLRGEVLTPRDIGIMMIGINLPMTVYFLYDVFGTIKQDIAIIRLETLTSSEKTEEKKVGKPKTAAKETPIKEEHVIVNPIVSNAEESDEEAADDSQSPTGR